MRLSLSVAGSTLAVTFAGETMARKWTLPYDDAATAATARAIIDIMARGNRARSLSDKNLDDLRHRGEELWRTLIPPELGKELARGDSLQLELDEALVAIPWELLHDGNEFLCRRSSIGRIVATRQPRRGDERRSVGTPIRVLVMACDPRGDLPEVRREGEAIIDELEKHATIKARLSTAPDRAFALRYFKDYDLVHFAGHADAGGWFLADGKLAGDEIVKLAGGRPMPMVVVANGCQSGAMAPSPDSAADAAVDAAHVFGLANAFLTAGVRHYIGTQWEVVDGQSARFAAALYEHLADGKAIGAAVRHARAAVVADAGETALAWASYVLYGDPEVRPLHRPEAKAKLSSPWGVRIAARASAPWKRPAQKDEATAARGLAARDKLQAVERRMPAWVPAALGGVAAGLVGVTVAAWLMHRPQKPPGGHPTLSGVAVLPLSVGASIGDETHARELGWCLPPELTKDHAPVVAPEKLMTPEAQTNGAYDGQSARALGLAVGARWVLWGNVAGGIAHVTVSEVERDQIVYTSSFALDDIKKRCAALAAELAPKLR